MAEKKPAPKHKDDYGNYIVLNGQRLSIEKHPTDFSVLTQLENVDPAQYDRLATLTPSLLRAATTNPGERDRLMEEIRQDKVAHHIYSVKDSAEEIVIDDRVLLNLRYEGTGELERILRDYHLVYEGRMGEAHVLRLTNATKRNPVKLSNELAEREEVAACSPHVMLDLQRFQQPALLREQWYLDAGSFVHPDISRGADIDAPEAWELTKGHPDIVIAIIDDGFDLGHPAFSGIRIHPGKRNFVNNNDDPCPGDSDYHGTPVASIAVGAHHNDSPMRGIAPNCTFLPIRIGFGLASPQIDMLEVFRYVSERADVVSCSFGISPSGFDRMHPDFRREITRLCESGGRRRKGLVVVFSASNDDAPTFLDASENINGVLFTRPSAFGGMQIAEVPAGQPVFSGYPMTPGVIVVGAMSSLRRKSGYSCWGPHLSISAPSNNMHYISSFIAPGDVRRDRFIASYRGLGQVAAINRPMHGRPFDPIRRFDDPSTPTLREDLYTRGFGGTSGAAPIVAGVAALMLSMNSDLTAGEVRQSLMITADTDLDFSLDLANDPNLQGLTGEFISGHSRYFGAGKINAFRAVRRARSLRTNALDLNSAAPSALYVDSSRRVFDQSEDMANRMDGGACPPEALANAGVEVTVTHSFRGEIRIKVASLSGSQPEVVQAARQQGGSTNIRALSSEK